MSRDTKVVVGIVIVALFVGSIPAITPLVFGFGVQSGAWSSEAIYTATFRFFIELSGLHISVSIIGIGLSLYFRQRNLRKFRFTSIAFAILLVGTILSAAFSAWLNVNYIQAGVPVSESVAAYSAFSCAAALANIVFWAMLFVVTFGKKLDAIDEIVSGQS